MSMLSLSINNCQADLRISTDLWSGHPLYPIKLSDTQLLFTTEAEYEGQDPILKDDVYYYGFDLLDYPTPRPYFDNFRVHTWEKLTFHRFHPHLEPVGFCGHHQGIGELPWAYQRHPSTQHALQPTDYTTLSMSFTRSSTLSLTLSRCPFP